MSEQRTSSKRSTVVGGVARLVLLAAPAVAITRVAASDTRPTAIEVTYSSNGNKASSVSLLRLDHLAVVKL